jgi:hypothetical protein
MTSRSVGWRGLAIAPTARGLCWTCASRTIPPALVMRRNSCPAVSLKLSEPRQDLTLRWSNPADLDRSVGGA